MSEEIVNWTNDDLWNVRDRHVIFCDGSRHLVKLYDWGGAGYRAGWAVGKLDGMDIWSARYLLNSNEARVEP